MAIVGPDFSVELPRWVLEGLNVEIGDAISFVPMADGRSRLVNITEKPPATPDEIKQRIDDWLGPEKPGGADQPR